MKQYIDIDSSFTPHPETKDLVLKFGTQAISTSIKNLVLSRKYDHPFNPSINGGVSMLLFEPISSHTAESIETMVKEVINNHEPRARILKVIVKPNTELQTYSVTVIFTENGSDSPQTAKITLERVR
jgi:phage baseplate assembly protein W